MRSTGTRLGLVLWVIDSSSISRLGDSGVEFAKIFRLKIFQATALSPSEPVSDDELFANTGALLEGARAIASLGLASTVYSAPSSHQMDFRKIGVLRQVRNADDADDFCVVGIKE
jgi:hypothetical protein